MLSKRKLKNLEKNLSVTLQVEIDPLVNKLEYTNNKRLSKPSLPNVLEPFKLLLRANGLLGVLSSLAIRIPQYARLHLPSLTGFFWQISKASQTPKHSLHFEVGCVWVQISSQCLIILEGRIRDHNDFSLNDE